MQKFSFRTFLGGMVVYSLLTVSMNASAQAIETDVLAGKVGILEFRIPAVTGWKETNEARGRVIELMRSEGANAEPAFAFENSKTGAVLFGTWTPIRPGLAFDAEQLAAEPPWFPESWGLKLSQVDGIFVPSAKGMHYAQLRAAGFGDGRTFSGKVKTVKTLGIWVTMPIQYETASGSGSGVVTFDYRGPDGVDSKNQKVTGDTLMNALIDGLKAQNGIRLISSDVYRAKYPKESSSAAKETSTHERTTASAQGSGSVAGPKSDVANKEVSTAISLINEPIVSSRGRADAVLGTTTPKEAEALMQKCAVLEAIPADGSMLDLVVKVRENNAKAVDCARRHDQLIDWINAQKGKK
jgi:hypothetical protein